MASLKKKLKKLKKKASKVIKKVGKAVGTGLRVAAPLAAAFIPGAQGLAIAAGAGIAGSALKGGNRKKKLKALKRTGINTAAAFAGKTALGIVSGSGAGASVIASVAKIGSSIFGGGAAPASGGTSGLDEAMLGDGGGSDSGMSDKLAAAVGLGSSILSGGGPGGVGSGMPGQTVNGAEAGERGGGPVGDSYGQVDPGLDASATGEGSGKGLLIALGIGAAILLMSRKK